MIHNCYLVSNAGAFVKFQICYFKSQSHNDNLLEAFYVFREDYNPEVDLDQFLKLFTSKESLLLYLENKDSGFKFEIRYPVMFKKTIDGYERIGVSMYTDLDLSMFLNNSDWLTDGF